MKTIKNWFYRFGYRAQWIIGLALMGLMNAAVLPFASAASQPGSIPDLGVTDVNTFSSKILCPISNGFFWVLIGISVIMVLWAAYLYITAQDEAEKVTRATKTITYAAVGIAVALIAKTFPGFIGSIFNATSSGDWSCS